MQKNNGLGDQPFGRANEGSDMRRRCAKAQVASYCEPQSGHRCPVLHMIEALDGRSVEAEEGLGERSCGVISQMSESEARDGMVPVGSSL